MPQSILFEVRCPHCRFVELWGLERALRELVAAGRYRARADFDPDMIRELFLIHSDKIDCPECDRKGLSAKLASSDVWSWADEMCCECCGKIIPVERLAAVPGTTLCVKCQTAMERGETSGLPNANHAVGAAEYCPRCGEIMTLKPDSSGGITRYVLACPKCRNFRR